MLRTSSDRVYANLRVSERVIKQDFEKKRKRRRNYCKLNIRVIVKFVPEVIPEPDELEALRAGREDRAVSGTIPHEAINWD